MGIPDLERHSRDCAICAHKEREEIEREFLQWESPSRLARRFHVARRSIYRHAHALDLLTKRSHNIRSALERIIERGCETAVGARGLVAAVEAYSKINAQGRWVEKRELLNLNQLFDKMSEEELETYATKGELPRWFETALAGTLAPSNQESSEENK